MLLFEALWPGTDNQSFYSWAGSVSRSIGNADGRNPTNGLYQLRDGVWSQVQINPGSIFPSLVRPAAGATASGNGMAYYLGGYNAQLEPSSNGPFDAITGLVSYNMSSNTWSNTSSLPYNYDGTAFWGAMEHIPTFGTEGLLVMFGGEESAPGSWSDNGSNFQSFGNISIYDPAGSGTWYSQDTTGNTGFGDIPYDSDLFCWVGAQSDIGTYEM